MTRPMGDLAAAWVDVATVVGARGDLARAGARLLSRWVEPHRRYHDMRHLAAVLSRVDQLAAEARAVDLVRLAAWFHDAVYDPERADNERRSADLARETLLELDVDDNVVAEVERLVLVTATHQAAADDRNGAVLCDADLAVLAGSPQEYDAYVRGVREEYAAYDRDQFRAGRAAVLRALLDRPALFSTAYGRSRWEDRARANVNRELRQLEA